LRRLANLPKEGKKPKEARSGGQIAELENPVALSLPIAVYQEGVKVSMKNGILSLSVPKVKKGLVEKKIAFS
jgi:HSP20 family molecular chaperone IbpA